MIGMRKLWVAALAGIALGGPAQADVCSGPSAFTDVAATDVFCSSAIYLQNRGITAGCGGGLFCPSEFLTRAQAALFFERNGQLAPRTAQTFGNPAPWDGAASQCESPPLPVVQYGRMVRADLRVYGLANAGFDLTVEAKRSEDGGATYPAGNITILEQTIGGAGRFNVPLTTYGGFNGGLNPRVGFRITASNPGVIVSGGCEVVWLVTERIPL